jgi:hypothetical protein
VQVGREYFYHVFTICIGVVLGYNMSVSRHISK